MNCFIIAAITADGFIAQNPEQTSLEWTSGADKKHFVKMTKKAGVVVMGSKTYETIGRPLPDRLNIIYTRSDKKYKGAETTDKEPAELLKDLQQRGFKEVAICGGGTIYSLFLGAGVVDKIYLTIEPKLFGQGVKLLNESTALNLKLQSVKNLSPDVLLLEYIISK